MLAHRDLVGAADRTAAAAAKVGARSPAPPRQPGGAGLLLAPTTATPPASPPQIGPANPSAKAQKAAQADRPDTPLAL